MACAYSDADDLLECPVCMEIMIEPKQLPCGHSLCNGCMDKLTGAAGDFTASCAGSNVVCPTCRQHARVPDNGFSTNFPLSAIIGRHMTEQEKQCHKCMMCDKPNALGDMIMCHSCGDMSLCLNCCFSTHDGHVREKLHDHMDNQMKQLQKWIDAKLPVIGAQSLVPPEVFNRCKELLDQHQANQLIIGQKCKDFEGKSRLLMDSNELNASNGYKFDFASLEDQLQAIQGEHKESTTKELVNVMSKLLLSGDGDVSDSDVDPISMSETGILLTDGQYFEFYSPTTNTITIGQLIYMGMYARYGFVMEMLRDGTVMVAGGINKGINQSAPTQVINVVSKQVMQGPPMTTGRCDAASTTIDGEMYVCGGTNQAYNVLSSCEVYRNGQWMAIADMKVPRCGHAVVALNGLLYAIGGNGHNIGGDLNSVECYTPETNSWRTVPPLRQPRHRLSAAVLNGYVYAAGGGLRSVQQSCERYCPIKNQWVTVAHMNKGRQSFSLVPFGDKLYALGGQGGNTVESYDAEKNRWNMEGITLNKYCPKTVVLNYNPTG